MSNWKMRLLAVSAAMAMMLAIVGPAMAETTTNEGSIQESDSFISVEGDEDFDFDEDDYFSAEDEFFFFVEDVEFEDGEFEFDEDETFFFVEG
jgi:hypothetical protein